MDAFLSNPMSFRHMSMIESALRLLACLPGLFTILFSLAGVYAARLHWVRRRSAGDASPSHLPPVTILKPIKGADREMYANLASFMRQDYPRFQVLFTLQNPEDPSLPVLKRLRRDFPGVDMEIIVSKNRIGFNPKVNNLSNAEPFIRHETLLISDSDIRVQPNFLKRTAAPLADPKVGMVTCFYKSLCGPGLGSLLEACSINSHFLPQALVAGLTLRLRFAMGAAMLVRRDVFKEIGGFSALSQHLADDFVLGEAIRSAGYRLEFSDALVDSEPGMPSVAGHVAHSARAARTIRVCQPRGYAGLFLLQGFALPVLYMVLFGPRPGILALCAAVAAARIVSVGWMHLAYLDNPGIWAQLPLIPLEDLIQFLAWVSGFRSRKVLWRGEYYHIRVGGRLVPAEEKNPVAIAAIP